MKKAIKSRIIILLSIAIVAMLFVVVLQKHAIVGNTNNEKTIAKNEITAPIVQSGEKVSQDYGPVSGEKLPIPMEQPPIETDPNLDSEETRESLLDIENETKRLYSKYKPFFEDLGLNSEDAELLSGIFLEKMVVGNDLINQIMQLGQDQIEEEKEITLELVPSICEEFDNEIKDILGEANYEKYKNYEDTYEDRMILEGFNSLLDADNSLSKEQIYDLTQELYAIREKYYRKFEYTLGYLSGKTSEETREKAIYYKLDGDKKIEQMGEEYLAKAEEVLSEDQYEQFDIYYNMNYLGVTQSPTSETVVEHIRPTQ